MILKEWIVFIYIFHLPLSIVYDWIKQCDQIQPNLCLKPSANVQMCFYFVQKGNDWMTKSFNM